MYDSGSLGIVDIVQINKYIWLIAGAEELAAEMLEMLQRGGVQLQEGSEVTVLPEGSAGVQQQEGKVRGTEGEVVFEISIEDLGAGEEEGEGRKVNVELKEGSTQEKSSAKTSAVKTEPEEVSSPRRGMKDCLSCAYYIDINVNST